MTFKGISPEDERYINRDIEAARRARDPNQQSRHERQMKDRGREDRLISVPPPSEPYVRFSRIRLSG
jgi:hypothetical protein